MSKRLTVDDYMQMPWHYCTKATQWGNSKGFWITVAELPDCSTFAPSIEEGLSLMPNLLKEYLQAAIKSQAEISVSEQKIRLSEKVEMYPLR